MTVAPIVLFTYARPDHARRTVDALLKNPQALSSDLFVFSDAARTPDKQPAVDAVRAYLATITGFRTVNIHHRPYNFGLAKSIIEGVSQILSEHERVVVLEDDMETSPHFLTYMNEALDLFVADERVISVHGYVYPVDQPLPEAFFLLGADCWGWATWRRGWALFNPDGKYLLNELKKQKKTKAFDFNGANPFTKMLEDQIKGQNDSWAIRWHASAFLAGKLTLHPGRSLVHNIGNDSSGTHCGSSETYDIKVSANPINLSCVEVVPSSEGEAAFECFYKQSRVSLVRRIARRVIAILTKK